MHGPNVTLFFRNCSGVPKTINFFDGATASQVIIDGIPPYAMCKTTVQTLTSAGGDIAFDNSLVQGGIVRLNSSTFQLPAGGTYNITATIVFTVNTVNSNMTFTTVRIGDTTSTLISNTWTGTNLHVGTWTATIQAVVVTPFQSSSATNVGSIGIAYTTDNDLSVSANTGAIQITQIKY